MLNWIFAPLHAAVQRITATLDEFNARIRAQLLGELPPRETGLLDDKREVIESEEAPSTNGASPRKRVKV